MKKVLTNGIRYAIIDSQGVERTVSPPKPSAPAYLESCLFVSFLFHFFFILFFGDIRHKFKTFIIRFTILYRQHTYSYGYTSYGQDRFRSSYCNRSLHIRV